MDRFKMSSVLNEVIRRKVGRVAVGYAVVMWLVLQIADVTFEPLNIPDWTLSLLLVIAVAGFAVAIVLAWAFELTPEGLKRDLRGQPEISADNDARMVSEQAHRSVAVLPFADMSSARDQRYFCEGIAEEILSLLATVKYLRVPSRTSSFRFNSGDYDIREIGKALNVETVLEGSVRKNSDRLRITAQLIDVRSGYHVWAKVYDQKLSGLFELQRELAQDIVRQLCESLNSEEIVFPEPTSAADIHAYDYYFQGRYFLNRHSEQSVKFAIQMFTKAIEIDAGMPLAWAGLCEAHTYVYINCPNSKEHRKFAWDAAERAISLSPDSAPCRTALGMALMIAGRYADADVEFSSALSMNPLQFWASYYYARSCLLQGKLEQAAKLFERAHEYRPEDYQAPLLLRSIYKRLGRNDEAYKAAHRGTELAERHLELHPDDTRALSLGCLGFLELGKLDMGRNWAERAIALNPTDCLTRYNVACFYAQAGDIDLAFANLSKVCIKRKEFVDWIANVPDLGALRSDPRFEALI